MLAEITSPDSDCLVIDPGLITPANAEAIASAMSEFPRPFVVAGSITTVALDSAVILARRAPARFIFRGVPTERAAVEQALLLTPDVKLRGELLSALDAYLVRLPPTIRDRLTEVFLTGDGARSLDALAATTALTRRSLDRYLADAGFVSGKRLLDAARIVSAYRAITRTNVPLATIARMLGYTMRTMDAQFMVLIDLSCRGLRERPMSVDEMTRRIMRKVTGKPGSE